MLRKYRPLSLGTGPTTTDIVRSQWKDPEKWRRLGESFSAGNPFAVLEDFLEPKVLQEEVKAQVFRSHRSQATRAGRVRILKGRIFELMRNRPLQELVHGLLHVPVNDNIILQGWELEPGDYLKVHTDGPRYLATLSIGALQAGVRIWGALSFGEFIDGRSPNIDGFPNWGRLFCFDLSPTSGIGWIRCLRGLDIRSPGGG